MGLCDVGVWMNIPDRAAIKYPNIVDLFWVDDPWT